MLSATLENRPIPLKTGGLKAAAIRGIMTDLTLRQHAHPMHATVVGRWLLLAMVATVTLPDARAATRVSSGLRVLYDFQSSEGNMVRDRSGVGEPLDLKITNPKAVNRTQGSLEVLDTTLIRSDKPAAKIIDAVRQTGELTVEAWVRPADTGLSGPARIVTVSKDTGERDFTLGQQGDTFDARFRTTQTDGNGNPSLGSPKGSLTREVTHVVYTRARSGRARVFLNGQKTAERNVPGDVSNWIQSHRLALANEVSSDRPWKGTYFLVALYNRDLSPNEVKENFNAGPDARAAEGPLANHSVGPVASGLARTRSGLQVLYDFQSSEGAVVRDRSKVGEPLNLTIADSKAVSRSEGTLQVRGKTLIQSDKPATKIIDAVRRSGELTMEAWVRPANTELSGPARIVTLSKNANERNATLGQDKDRFEVRLRTTSTSANGVPAINSAAHSVTPKLTHVVYTRDRSGRTRIYVDGKQSGEGKAEGATSNWDGSLKFALANELSGDRPWQGTYHLVAVYSRSLSPKEIGEHFQVGARPEDGSIPLVQGLTPNGRLFSSSVASLFAQRCLECHDAATRKGGLDLSHKDAALAGGKSGDAIVPGKSSDSLLWDAVASNEMPDEQPPLSDAEKQVLKEWIDGGATWTFDTIDPSFYAHDSRIAENGLRRLTVPEYIETVRSAVGVDLAREAREILPPDLRADGFANTAYNLNVDFKHVEAYARLAEIAVGRMDVLAYASEFSKSRKLTDDDMRALIGKMGKWILRGPLVEHEINAYRGISTTVASAGGDFKEAVRFILTAMLQSPRFLYHIESQRGDGTLWPAGDHELASRLSYSLWAAPPDKALMKAAEDGELYDDRLVAAQVKRMLQDPRAVSRSVQFIAEWLNLNRLEHLQPNPDRFPKWNQDLARDMREETIAFFKDLVWDQKRPLAELLNAQFTRVSPRLAAYYGLDPKSAQGDRYDLASVPGRGGLLTQGSVLTVGGDEASMVSRGLFVLRDFLRGTVKDPPPCVDTTPVPTMTGLTQRGIAEQRIANATCGGCHSKFEPLAFGLEKFDGLGAYHEVDEHGNKLRDDGEILIPGMAKALPYKSSAELMNLLAGTERVSQAITAKVTQFALGRPLGAADVPALDKIHAEAQKGGGTYASLITAVVLSDLVRMTRTETTQ